MGDVEILYAAVRYHTLALAILQENQLPTVTDGRLSGGPIDIAAFLEMPDVQEQVGHPPPQRCTALLGRSYELQFMAYLRAHGASS